MGSYRDSVLYSFNNVYEHLFRNCYCYIMQFNKGVVTKIVEKHYDFVVVLRIMLIINSPLVWTIHKSGSGLYHKIKNYQIQKWFFNMNQNEIIGKWKWRATLKSNMESTAATSSTLLMIVAAIFSFLVNTHFLNSNSFFIQAL